MRSQHNKIKLVLDNAYSTSHINKSIVNKFNKRLSQKIGLTRDENPKDHFSTFFVPFISKTKQVFIGDHIKAGEWLIPGGHIEKDESPADTIYREIQEELNYRAQTDEVKFLDLSITDIPASDYPCDRHYDFWYIIYFKSQIPFEYTRKEYSKALWMSIEEALKLTTDKDQSGVLNKLSTS